MTKEIWRPILSGVYAVSNLGRVKRVVRYQNTGSKSGVLSQQLQNSGYLIVHLSINNKHKMRTAHSLVAEAFIGPRPPGLDVNHKDGVKTNNSDSNLEYVTRRDNLCHSVRLGLTKSGENCPWTKLTADIVRDVRRRYRPGNGGDLGREYGITAKNFHNIVRRQTWKHI